ncbi:MAG: hypothetical protein IPM64_01885 [Phycisphaerales bacterium]|nr:hypothetical protein [Phycisphaerales bacterium]
MNFFEWLLTRRKTLATMSVAELRAQEMLLENERDRAHARIAKLGEQKQKIVADGAKERTPELRNALAQQFDLLHTEQMMLARQLTTRTKEHITVARLRMLRENAGRSGVGSRKAMIGDGELALIERLIENERIGAEVYQERLDAILRAGLEADESGVVVSPAAGELLRVWKEMDSGLIADSRQATDEAERRVRERLAEEG